MSTFKPASEIKALTNTKFNVAFQKELEMVTPQIIELIDNAQERGEYTARVCFASCSSSAEVYAEVKLAPNTLVRPGIDFTMQTKLMVSLSKSLRDCGYYIGNDSLLTDFCALGLHVLTINWKSDSNYRNELLE